jgi:hypothetical protein
MTRDKRDCMRLGTGLYPRSETWADTEEPCDSCAHFINRYGETGGEDERA